MLYLVLQLLDNLPTTWCLFEIDKNNIALNFLKESEDF